MLTSSSVIINPTNCDLNVSQLVTKCNKMVSEIQELEQWGQGILKLSVFHQFKM
jgi:hypothetical protein